MKLKVSKFFFISFFVSLLVFEITNHEFPYKVENNVLDNFNRLSFYSLLLSLIN